MYEYNYFAYKIKDFSSDNIESFLEHFQDDADSILYVREDIINRILKLSKNYNIDIRKILSDMSDMDDVCSMLIDSKHLYNDSNNNNVDIFNHICNYYCKLNKISNTFIDFILHIGSLEEYLDSTRIQKTNTLSSPKRTSAPCPYITHMVNVIQNINASSSTVINVTPIIPIIPNISNISNISNTNNQSSQSRRNKRNKHNINTILASNTHNTHNIPLLQIGNVINKSNLPIDNIINESDLLIDNVINKSTYQLII